MLIFENIMKKILNRPQLSSTSIHLTERKNNTLPSHNLHSVAYPFPYPLFSEEKMGTPQHNNSSLPLAQFRKNQLPSTPIVSVQSLNSFSRTGTVLPHSSHCGCTSAPSPPLMPLGTSQKPSANLEDIDNYDKFNGIVGKYPVSLQPKDDRKIVPNLSALPYSLMVQFTVDVPNNPPWVVGTGVIVSHHHVLTAAHVVFSAFGDGPLSSMLTVRMISGPKVTSSIVNTHVHTNYIDGAPWKLLAKPSAIEDFATLDYALVKTEKQLLPPNSNFFKYGVLPSSKWNAIQLTHLGFPSNYSIVNNNTQKMTNFPCFDALPSSPGLFDGWSFGKCDGLLREQRLTWSRGTIGSRVGRKFLRLNIWPQWRSRL